MKKRMDDALANDFFVSSRSNEVRVAPSIGPPVLREADGNFVSD
jgi:hypothetical protein